MESMGLDTPRGAIRLLLLVIRVSLIAETVMAVPLFVGFARREERLGVPTWPSST